VWQQPEKGSRRARTLGRGGDKENRTCGFEDLKGGDRFEKRPKSSDSQEKTGAMSGQKKEN